MKERWNRLNLAIKFLTLTSLTILAVMAGLVWWLSAQMRADMVALLHNRSIVIQRQIEVTRAYIASQYVAKIKNASEGKVKIAQEHTAPDTVPFPATATREMAETLSQEGMFNARVISDMPLNPANKPNGAFEERGIKALAAGEKEATTVEPVNGVLTFRRMTPDIIQTQACIACHTDKKMGDMVGAVSVAIPMTLAISRVDHNVNTLMSVAGFAALLMGAVLYLGLRSQVTRPIQNLQAAVKSLAHGDLSARAAIVTKDEVGQLAEAFNEMGAKLEQASAKQQEMVATLNNAQANLVICDRSLCMTYVNKGAESSFRKLAEVLRQVLPALDMSKLVGGSLVGLVDQSRAFQRAVKDPASLPAREDVRIGALILDITMNALKSAKGDCLGYTIEWVDVSEKREAERAVTRMQSAIQHAGVNFMIADEQENIIFLNQAAYNTLKGLEKELRQYLPGFEVDKVLGGSIHRYHKDPQAIKNILAGLKPGDVRRGEIKPGPFIFEHETRAVYDNAGQKLAYVVQWRDVTSERRAMELMQQVIADAAKGELSHRVELTNLDGACKNVAANMNRLLDAVVTPLRESQEILASMAGGDLTRSMTGDYEGEFLKIKTSLNTAIGNLNRTLMAVREAVEGVSSGAEQITKGNEDLSQRTSEQASSLEETSASMEEMTSTVKQNADNAKQANQLASAARETADKGGAVTVRAVEAMGEINKSSKKIADIITVIDEIAFQTNLLALNAAVEAARAGEHGRGFAVVAAEVRNLAQRSATAAKEIKGLINESIQRVNDGSELVNQSGKTLEEIVASVKRVSDIIAEITAASQEQASGIDQVNKAIMSMDETTQQNAALVEETTSASQSMKEQAKALMKQVEVFKVSGTGSGPQRTVSGSPQRQGGQTPRAPQRGQAPRGDAGKGTSPQPAGIASGNGHDRRAKSDEFEEF